MLSLSFSFASLHVWTIKLYSQWWALQDLNRLKITVFLQKFKWLMIHAIFIEFDAVSNTMASELYNVLYSIVSEWVGYNSWTCWSIFSLFSCRQFKSLCSFHHTQIALWNTHSHTIWLENFVRLYLSSVILFCWLSILNEMDFHFGLKSEKN